MFVVEKVLRLLSIELAALFPFLVLDCVALSKGIPSEPDHHSLKTTMNQTSLILIKDMLFYYFTKKGYGLPRSSTDQFCNQICSHFCSHFCDQK